MHAVIEFGSHFTDGFCPFAQPFFSRVLRVPDRTAAFFCRVLHDVTDGCEPVVQKTLDLFFLFAGCFVQEMQRVFEFL